MFSLIFLILLIDVYHSDGLYTKITGGQRIDLFGAQKQDLPDIWEELVNAGFESGHAYGTHSSPSTWDITSHPSAFRKVTSDGQILCWHNLVPLWSWGFGRVYVLIQWVLWISNTSIS
jgi:hypothetical protein